MLNMALPDHLQIHDLVQFKQGRSDLGVNKAEEKGERRPAWRPNTRLALAGPPAAPKRLLDFASSLKVEPADTSHVFFTSGSTGRPKGCIVAHSALLCYGAARNKVYNADHTSNALIASAHTFDPSLGDLVATLMVGGCSTFAPRELLFPHLGPILSISAATHLCCTPSLFGVLNGSGWDLLGALPSLAVVALGGEPTPPTILEIWATSARERFRLLNTYGVTECCVYNSACHQFASVPEGERTKGLIGAPLPGNILAVVRGKTDEGGDPLEASAPGEMGELLVGGDQVGYGYARRADLTRERFVDHPVLGKVYLSGDLARMGPDGIALLGRRDNQVKVHGHRIELDEAEHLFLAAVSGSLKLGAVACVNGDLVAFCVRANGVQALSSAQAHNLCNKAMPLAMRPHRFVFLEDLPKTGSGKIARGQLPELLVNLKEEDASDVPPSVGEHLTFNRIEKAVADTWAAELHVPVSSLTRASHFRSLGGHSIAAVRACQQLLQSLPKHGLILECSDAERIQAFAPAELLRTPRLGEYAQNLSLRCIFKHDSKEEAFKLAPSGFGPFTAVSCITRRIFWG